MVSDTSTTHSILFETKLMREQAGLVLEHLLETRNFIEHRIEQSGRDDPIKAVTGHSAFDEAISSARRLIGRMDELLDCPGASNGSHRPNSVASTPRSMIAAQ